MAAVAWQYRTRGSLIVEPELPEARVGCGGIHRNHHPGWCRGAGLAAVQGGLCRAGPSNPTLPERDPDSYPCKSQSECRGLSLADPPGHPSHSSLRVLRAERRGDHSDPLSHTQDQRLSFVVRVAQRLSDKVPDHFADPLDGRGRGQGGWRQILPLVGTIS